MASSFSQMCVAQTRLAHSRMALVLSAVVMLGACSVNERLPPVEVSGVPKGMRGERVLEGRVRDVDMAQRRGGYEEPIAYAAPTSNGNGGSAGIDYLDTPNLAGSNFQSDDQQQMQAHASTGMAAAATLASMDSDAAGQGSLIIPEGGVSMDAELGIASAESEGASPQQIEGVQPQIVTSGGAMAIAEGTTSQPVVDGIGFDNPTSVNAGQPQPVVAEMPVAEIGGEYAAGAEDGILPLAVDSGTTGMGDGTGGGMDSKPAVDCSLYLDKRNCPKG
ncbi:hypothetical protein [Rhizobium sp. 18065]|uniref:hypothetical protein n=1 Tax=Rhizobium sp. 18065 TaxID=2681411 RepID=UPI001357F905|nr:hypothetical protein [Rhizobium sp. 18065]